MIVVNYDFRRYILQSVKKELFFAPKVDAFMLSRHKSDFLIQKEIQNMQQIRIYPQTFRMF